MQIHNERPDVEVKRFNPDTGSLDVLSPVDKKVTAFVKPQEVKTERMMRRDAYNALDAGDWNSVYEIAKEHLGYE